MLTNSLLRDIFILDFFFFVEVRMSLGVFLFPLQFYVLFSSKYEFIFNVRIGTEIILKLLTLYKTSFKNNFGFGNKCGPLYILF